MLGGAVIMCDKYYLTRRNIDKYGNIIWKGYDEKFGDYAYKCHIDNADEFSIEQIKEMQSKDLYSVVLDYAYKKEDILKLGTKLICAEQIKNLENFRLVKSYIPKRRPLPDGIIPLTDEELKEFANLFGYEQVKEIKLLKDVALFITYEDCSPFRNAIKENKTYLNLKEILWLAERFDLTKMSKSYGDTNG